MIKRLKHIAGFFFVKHRKKSLVVFAIGLLAYWFCLPRPLFDVPTSMVVLDKDNQLLGARIAADGQWRFPYRDSIPHKFSNALLEFEDRRFYNHPGIDAKAIARAMDQNIRNRSIVSGGSTLTMQLMRMARGKTSRSIWNKALEAVMATRMELTYSKDEILAYYSSNAPFGGNVVGLDAASWRYYAKEPELLSWGEAATLAVLPNSPSLVHPGRNRNALRAKRNRLLDRLQAAGKIDQLTCELSKEEPLPEKPHPLPRMAPHLLERAYAEQYSGKRGAITRLRTTIDGSLQEQATRIAKQHHLRLRQNGIQNLAAVIMEVETGNVVAYIGNVPSGKENGEEVDVVMANRSTGSIIKPLLYAGMIQDGSLLSGQLVSDIPTNMGSFSPKNYNSEYDGAVPAQKALSRSLNVPTVKMLERHGVHKFHHELKRAGITTINKPADHYGLALILGGAEVKLWEITNTYACMARTLNRFYNRSSRYNPTDFRPPNYVFETKEEEEDPSTLLSDPTHISAAASWFTFDAMQQVERPNSSGAWNYYESSRPIAWKTGTSHGFRDAWAVGVMPNYAVGVWVGNADGEGRPTLVGVQAAAPVLFDLVELLPHGGWFDPPYDEMVQIPVCKSSGFRISEHCAAADTVWVAAAGLKGGACPFHRVVHLDASRKHQVHSDCESPADMVHDNWFVLPPIQEHFYKSNNPSYEVLPPFREDCKGMMAESNRPMQLIYPREVSKIYIPKDLDGEKSRTVFRVAHRKPTTTIYWHLNDTYAGQTNDFHQLAFNPEPGRHVLTLVDEEGFRLEQAFEILVH